MLVYKMLLVAGTNLFGQWLVENRIFSNFQAISLKNLTNLDSNLNQAQLNCINWSYNIFKIGKNFYVSGSWRGKDNQLIEVDLPVDCDSSKPDLTLVGNDYNLLLIDSTTHTMWVMNIQSEDDVKKINFNIETPLPKMQQPKKFRKDYTIVKVIATNNLCLCLTAEGVLYSGLLPSHLDTSHCQGRVCDVQCGYEHCLLLTDVGKVYSWGNGRRLQLGHGDLDNLEIPTELESLSGIRINKIGAGGWHSLALSEFGDLYAWGWNDTGQLGIKTQSGHENEVKDCGVKSCMIPSLVDLFDENDQEISLNVKDLACGSRHSAILLEDNTVWTTGFNKYGQLGFSPNEHPIINYFKKSFECGENFKLVCGPWSTVLIEK